MARAANLTEPVNWMESIADLAKLIGIHPSEKEFIRMAHVLRFDGDQNDSRQLHIWLHRQLMQILAANGGYLPSYLTEFSVKEKLK